MEIRVVVKEKPKTVEKTDKQLIQEGYQKLKAKNKNTKFGAYIDIALQKRYAGEDWESIAEASKDIAITIPIPDSLLKKNATYYIGRAHEGTYKLLTDEDKKDSTITISTRLFSTYAILYEYEKPVCYWHIFILAVLAADIFMELFAEKKKKKHYGKWILLLSSAVMLVFAWFGTCRFDWPAAALGIVLAALFLWIRSRKQTEENQTEER